MRGTKACVSIAILVNPFVSVTPLLPTCRFCSGTKQPSPPTAYIPAFHHITLRRLYNSTKDEFWAITKTIQLAQLSNVHSSHSARAVAPQARCKPLFPAHRILQAINLSHSDVDVQTGVLQSVCGLVEDFVFHALHRDLSRRNVSIWCICSWFMLVITRATQHTWLSQVSRSLQRTATTVCAVHQLLHQSG